MVEVIEIKLGILKNVEKQLGKDFINYSQI
jgi:hypothetical protein